MDKRKTKKRMLSIMLLLSLLFTAVLPKAVVFAKGQKGMEKLYGIAGSSMVHTAKGSEVQMIGLGDSITSGYGLESDAECYVNLVAEEKEKSFVNYAVDGQTTAGLKKQMKNAKSSKKPGSDIKNAEYILVTIGGNDLMNALYKEAAKEAGCSQKQLMKRLSEPKKDYQVFFKAVTAVQTAANKLAKGGIHKTITACKKNLKASIASIRKLNTSAVIILQTQYNPYLSLRDYTYFSATVKDIDTCVKKYNTVVKSVAKGKNCKAANVYKAFKDSDQNLTNVSADMADFSLDFHPNVEGHKKIAEVVGAVIKS